MPSFDSMEAGYTNLWNRAEIDKNERAELETAARKLLKSKARYEAIEAKTSVPWEWIAAVHYRESAGSFDGVLHNGQDIIGKGTKTTWVPKGRGPFNTWEESAVDALALQRLNQVKDWSIARRLYEFERYNGFGYLGKINSPYVWAKTNLQQRGKYIADGVYSASTWDDQPGCAALLKVLAEMDEDVARRLRGEPVPPESSDPGDTTPPPVIDLGQYSVDALVAELLERPYVVDVNISFNKSGK